MPGRRREVTRMRARVITEGIGNYLYKYCQERRIHGAIAFKYLLSV
jgi:hypothetical protein